MNKDIALVLQGFLALNDNEKNYTVPFLVDFYHAFFSRWNKIRKTVFC